MADTHINVFIADVEDAFKQLLAAAHDYHEKVEALKSKLGVEAAKAGLDVPGLAPPAPAGTEESTDAADVPEKTDDGSDVAKTDNKDKAKAKA